MKNTLRNKSVVVGCAGMLALLGSLGLTGCQTSDTAQVRFSSFAGQEDLTGAPIAVEVAKLALGDPIRVVFSGISDPPQPHEEQIKEDGTIDLPNIGVIKAEGKTTVELQKEIYEKYVPNYFKRLTVTVSTENRVYYVQGQVRSSGRQAYLGPTSVLKAIATAGDFTDFANRKRVVLTRADGTRIIVDCVKAARDSTYDLPVFPGDKIEVLMRGF
jgi:protein involved in polysaccharide export with SLBB domain